MAHSPEVMHWKEITGQIEVLTKQKIELIEGMDITGGRTGMRNNTRAWNKVKKLEQHIRQLNKQLFNL